MSGADKTIGQQLGDAVEAAKEKVGLGQHKSAEQHGKEAVNTGSEKATEFKHSVQEGMDKAKNTVDEKLS